MKRAHARLVLPGVAALTVALLVFSPPADAQVTVPSATFPVAGDTLKLSHDNAPGACAFTTLTPPGGSQNWDLTCLKADATQDIVYRPASEGSVPVAGAQLFAVTAPTGSLPFPSAQEEYYSGTSTDFVLQAIHGTFPALLSKAVFNLNPPLRLRAAPLNFFDIRQSSSGVLEAFDDTEISPEVLAQLPFSPDSVRLRMAITELAVVDAWGSMTIPGGSYDVLREKRTRYTETRVDAKIAPLGWLDVTDQFIQFTGAQYLGIDTVVHHNFYNDVSKEPIAVVRLNNELSAPVKVTFKSVQPVCQNDGDPCGDQSSSACNQPDTCLAGVCVPNFPPAGAACGSGAATACSSPDTCDGAGACLANDKPNGTACSDGNECTTGDSCQDATCTGGPPPNCNDDNACTIDSCSPATGCVHAPAPVCAPQIALLTAVQQQESCAPANGALDPSERVTYAVTLLNNGSQPTTNLTATLLASASVNWPSAAQSYGAIPPGGTATRWFTWTGLGACGAPWSADLALADGANSVPSVNISGSYGTPGGVCATGCAVVRIAIKTTTLRRNLDGTVRATVTVGNTGSVRANNVVLTSALLGMSGGMPLPRTLSRIPPGGSSTVTVTFPSSVLAGATVLRLGGTFTGGTYSSSLRVSVP